MSRNRNILDMKVIPGQPLDGTGKICIHLFLRDDAGPITENGVLHPAPNGKGVVAKPTRGRIACNSKVSNVQPRKVGKVTHIFHRTDDPRAVTCPKCLATEDCKTLMEQVEKVEKILNK